METLSLHFDADRNVPGRSHVGVVASGDLEVLMEPCEGSRSSVVIRTSIDGFEPAWRNVLGRFFQRFGGRVAIEINDAGASPGTALLRLEQAAELAERTT